MSTNFAIATFLEILASGLLIFGLIHEDKVIMFEQAVKRIVLGNIRRAIRIHQHKKAVARGEHLHLHSSQNRVSTTNSTVA